MTIYSMTENISTLGKREREMNGIDLIAKRPCVEEKMEEVKPVHASISISYSHGKSLVTDSFSTYPVRIVQQDAGDNHASLLMLGFGGGSTNVKLTVEENASAILKTVSQKKNFSSKDGSPFTQQIEAIVKENALLVMNPAPSSCNENSNFSANQRYFLEEGSSAVIVDWFTSGRQNKNEYWHFNTFQNEIALVNSESNQLIFAENQIVQNNPENRVNIFGHSVNELSHVNVCGVVVLYGPKTQSIRSSLKCFQTKQSLFDNQTRYSSLNVSTISDHLTVVRFMTPSVQHGYELLVELLSPLQESLGGKMPYQEHIHYDSEFEKRQSSTSHSVPIDFLNDQRSALLV